MHEHVGCFLGPLQQFRDLCAIRDILASTPTISLLSFEVGSKKETGAFELEMLNMAGRTRRYSMIFMVWLLVLNYRFRLPCGGETPPVPIYATE